MILLSDMLDKCVEALVCGWSEKVEYAVRIHSTHCGDECSCPIERRSRMVRHVGLIRQLEQASSIPTSSPGGGGNPNKSASKPPGNQATLDLIDTIKEQAWTNYVIVCQEANGNTPARTRHSVTQLLHNLLQVSMQAKEHHPRTIAKVTRSAGAWVRMAKVMLGYEKPMAMLATMVCGDCAGALTVASDASSDVACIGTPISPPCGRVYPRWQWVDLLGEGDSRYVTTETAVDAMVREGVTYSHARRTLYRWCHEGKVRNHGARLREGALWDLTEIRGMINKTRT